MSDNANPSPQAFGESLMKELHRRTGGQFRFNLDEFSILRLDKNITINLENIYHEHCKLNLEDRPDHIQKLAGIFGVGAPDLNSEYESIKTQLMPKIWPRSMLESLKFKSKVDGNPAFELPYVPIGEHLCLGVVHDTEDSMRSINQSQLDEWGVGLYQALEDARHNLNNATENYAALGDHVLCHLSGDGYDSSRILLTELIRSRNFTGPAVAIVPDRSSALIADSQDEAALDAIFSVAEKVRENPDRPLSPLPIMLVDDEWVDWEPPKDHAIRGQFETLRLYFLGGLYNDQQAFLNSLFEADSSAPFVASFSARQKEGTEEVKSYSLITEGIDSLLPRTDLLYFMAEDKSLRGYDWEEVEMHCGVLLAAEEFYYPIRYRVSRFPTEEEFSSMQESST